MESRRTLLPKSIADNDSRTELIVADKTESEGARYYVIDSKPLICA
jgi:hypothetical protein